MGVIAGAVTALISDDRTSTKTVKIYDAHAQSGWP
jgi:hypothetical protein